MADGSPSHAWVVEGVRHLRRYGVEHNVLVAVSAGNVAHGARIYRYLVDQGFLHHQYIPCVNLRADGSPDSHTVSGEQWGAFLNEVYDAWRVSDTHRVSVRLFDSVIERLVDGVANTCSMGSDCRQYFVVEHNGDVFPCDFFVEAAHRLGNVMTDSWYGLLESAQYARFGRRKSVLATGCASCRYRQLCGGDCPRHRRDPEGGRRSPSSLCRGWKAFYDHALPELNAIAATLGRKRRPGLRNDEREDDGRDDR